MHPFLSLGHFNVAVYGLCIIAGLGAGLLTAVLKASSFNIDKQDALFSLLYGAIGLVIGGKICYIVVSIKYIVSILPVYGIEPVLRGGFIFYGGVGGAAAAVFIYARQYKISYKPLISLLFFITPLVHSFGRLGCLFAGCCYGIPWDGWCAVFLHGQNRLPVQLIESVFNFLLFAVLFILSYFKKFIRFLPFIYLFYYSVFRFIIEFFRDDAERGTFGQFSTSQWISLVIIAALPVYHAYVFLRSR
jgi:phosphatidylglycerol---prolipoprotein diacylglyceryl transferase